MKPQAKERLSYLDSLRGVAILLVIATHVGSLLKLSGPLGKLVAPMGFGVQLFFVISAFTIYLTFQRSVDQKCRHPIIGFFARRLMRIYPVYWMGIILYLAAYGLDSRGWLPGPKDWHFILNALLLNIWAPDSQSSVVPGGWSISVEVMFYLSFPLFAKYVRSFRDAMYSLVATGIILPLVAIGARGLLGEFPPAESPKLLDYWWARSPLNQFGCFTLGFAFYFGVKENIFPALKKAWINLSAIAAGLLVIAFGIRFHLPVIPNSQLYALGCSIIAISVSYIPWRVIVNPVMQFIGKVSYSAYLFHFLIVYQIQRLLALDGSSRSFLLLYGSSVALTLIIAKISFELVERPSMAIGRKFVARLENSGTEKGHGRIPGQIPPPPLETARKVG